MAMALSTPFHAIPRHSMRATKRLARRRHLPLDPPIAAPTPVDGDDWGLSTSRILCTHLDNGEHGTATTPCTLMVAIVGPPGIIQKLTFGIAIVALGLTASIMAAQRQRQRI